MDIFCVVMAILYHCSRPQGRKHELCLILTPITKSKFLDNKIGGLQILFDYVSDDIYGVSHNINL